MKNLSFSIRALSFLVLPVMFLGLLLSLRPYMPELSQNALVLLANLPYVLLAVGGAIALQIKHTQLLLLAAVTAASYGIVQSKLQASLAQPGVADIYLALAIALPTLVLFLLFLPEQGPHSGVVLAASISGLVALAYASYWLAGYLPFAVPNNPEWVALWPTPDYVLPLALSALHFLVLLAGLFMLCLRNSPANAAMIVTLLCGTVLLAVFYLPNISTVTFTAAGISQVHGVLRCSHAMAFRDELTGLLGRRAYDDQLRRLAGRYSIAMLDIDHFKRFNDTYGHNVGDEVLKLVASKISRVGAGGIAFRYGGEEFCIMFPGRSAQQCVEPLERVRASIADYDLAIRDMAKRPKTSAAGKKLRGKTTPAEQASVTISLGLAERSRKCPKADDVYKAADMQLYAAKQGGRNRLSVLDA